MNRTPDSDTILADLADGVSIKEQATQAGVSRKTLYWRLQVDGYRIGRQLKYDPDTVYTFIVNYKIKHQGQSPTIREIADGCGISTTSMVVNILDRLEGAGKIKRPDFGLTRGINIPGSKWIPPNV